MTDDFHIVCEGKGAFHVLLAFVEETHTIIRIQMTFFFGRGQEAGCLSDSGSLSFEFKQSRFQSVKALSEALSFSLLVVSYRPRVGGVGHRKRRYAERQHHRWLSQRLAGGEREGQRRQRTNAGQNGSVAEDAEISTHRPMGELPAQNTGEEHQPTACHRRSIPFESKGAEAHQQRPRNRGRRSDSGPGCAVVEGQILNENTPDKNEKRCTKTCEDDAVTVAQSANRWPGQPHGTQQQGEGRHKRGVFHSLDANSPLGFNGCIRIRPGDHTNPSS